MRLTWGHGRYLDPWTILHLLTGSLLGIVALWFALPLWEMIIAITVVTVLYEVLEMALERTGKTYFLMWWWLSWVLGLPIQLSILVRFQRSCICF